MGVRYEGYGFSLYREQVFGVMGGYRVASRLGVGVLVRRLQVLVAGLGAHGWTVFDLGARVLPVKGVALGFVAWNVGGTKVGLLGQGGMVGIGFEVAPGLAMGVDVRKEAGMPTGVSTGLEYGVRDRAWLRGGAGGRPERLSLGVGVRYGVFRVDYAAVYHTVLGISHRLSVVVGGLGR